MAHIESFGDLIIPKEELRYNWLHGWVYMVMRSLENQSIAAAQAGIERHVFRTDGYSRSILDRGVMEEGAGTRAHLNETVLYAGEAMLPRPLYKAFGRFAVDEQVHTNVIFDRSNQKEPLIIGINSFGKTLRWPLETIDVGIAETINRMLRDA